MSWRLIGQISGTLFEVTAAGRRRLWGSGRARIHYEYLSADWSMFEDIATLVGGSLVTDGDPRTVSNIRTEWWLASRLEAERAWGSELYRAAQEFPEKAVVSCQVVPGVPDFDQPTHLVVAFILPDKHANVIYQHFMDLMRAQSVCFDFMFDGEENYFESHARLGGAKNAEGFVNGVPLLLAPAEVNVHFSYGKSEPEEGEEWRS